MASATSSSAFEFVLGSSDLLGIATLVSKNLLHYVARGHVSCWAEILARFDCWKGEGVWQKRKRHSLRGAAVDNALQLPTQRRQPVFPEPVTL